MIFDISNGKLTSLKDVKFPDGVTTLYCWGNQLTSLEHCPAGVTELYCGYNQLTSLEHCPGGVTTLDCWGNQLTESVIGEFRKSHPRCNVIA